MTVANLKIGRRSFVVVPEREFDRMQSENQRYRQLVEEDRALGRLAEKELKAFRKNGGHALQPFDERAKSPQQLRTDDD
jgi:hypothetical protein